jgi:hypothetical protein
MSEERMSDWQPIETAPRDGTSVLLWEQEATLRHDGIVICGSYVDFHGKAPDGYHDGWFDDVSGHYEVKPTHWMPLPAKPDFQPPAVPDAGRVALRALVAKWRAEAAEEERVSFCADELAAALRALSGETEER